MGHEEHDEREVSAPAEVDSASAALIASAEINQQIATAKRFPRSVKKFIDQATEMATLNEEIAQECVYALPRREWDQDKNEYVTKVIEGPSARFAEIVGSAWGNAHAGTRVVSDTGDFVTAQGVFWDLERNWKVVREVQRRITNKHGKRYGADMIGVTGNAASSIALRNAILAGVPKAFWNGIYQRARHVVLGDFKTLGTRRDNAFKEFVHYGLDKAQVCKIIGVPGEQDVTLELLAALAGILTALKEGGTTAEQLLAEAAASGKPPVAEPKSRSEQHPPGGDRKPAKPPKAAKAPKNQPPAPEKGADPAGAPTPAPGAKVSADALKMLRQNLASAKVPESEFCMYFGVEKMADFPSAKVKEAIDWMLKQRAEQGG